MCPTGGMRGSIFPCSLASQRALQLHSQPFANLFDTAQAALLRAGGPPHSPASLSSRACAHLAPYVVSMDRLLGWVDQNDDGRVTLDEVEQEAERLRRRAVAVASPVVRFCEAYRPWLQAGVGGITLFYGGHFKQSLLFYCGFEATQKEALLAQLRELREMYSAARSKIREDYGEVVLADYGDRAGAEGGGQGGDAAAQRAPLSLVVYRAVDPNRFLSVARCLYSGLCVGLAATMNESAARLGLGVQLGRRLCDFVAPAIGLVPREGEAGRPAPDPWSLLALETACTGLGLTVTFLFKGWAALWTTTSMGSALLVDASAEILGDLALWPQGDAQTLALQSSKVALAAVGFYSQMLHWGCAPIPWYLQVPLAPARLVETVLSLVAAQGAGAADPGPRWR